MQYKYGNRDQISLIPQSIEEYVSQEDPVRAYDAMIDSMDLYKLGQKNKSNSPGNLAYDPAAMLKLIVYGCSYGVNSSRKLERATYHNLSFIWLMGGLKPDHKTIANFRRNNSELLKNVFKQCVRVCVQLNLIKGNALFLDGSKIRGNCSREKIKEKDTLERHLNHIDERINEILEEFDKQEDSESESYVSLKKDLKKQERLKEKIKDAVEKLEVSGSRSINTTDPDSILYKSRQGSHSGYNVQSVEDGQHGLIVNIDAVSQATDMEQFSQQIGQAEINIGKKCDTAVADAGYFKVDDLEKIENSQTKVIVPSQNQALKVPTEEPFSKDKFCYNEEENTYTCPMGETLIFSTHNKGKDTLVYRINNKEICFKCEHFGACTSNKRGRMINRLPNEDVQQSIKQRYASDEGQAVYAQRKKVAELPFGHFKHNLDIKGFMMRGIDNVKAEAAIWGMCFNVRRMITILGGTLSFIEALEE